MQGFNGKHRNTISELKQYGGDHTFLYTYGTKRNSLLNSSSNFVVPLDQRSKHLSSVVSSILKLYYYFYIQSTNQVHVILYVQSTVVVGITMILLSDPTDSDVQVSIKFFLLYVYIVYK